MRLSFAEQFFLLIIKIGLWLIPFLPLYVSSSMLFPFITGKNFAFRIIVEIVFALWAGLAILRQEFRPRLTPLFKAATIFIVILFLADLFSPNPYRSFFSNYERMEGFMMLFHLYLYFVMLVSVFKGRDWMIFFHSTLAASIIVSYIALLQKLGYRVSLQGGFRVDSTIGNPTYLAAYLMFHIWTLLLLIYNFWKKRWAVLIYSAILCFELVIIYFTATRGAVVALTGTSILIAASIVIFWHRAFPGLSRWRPAAIAMLLFFIAVPLFFWSIRETSFVRQNLVLSRLTNYSLEERTIQSRFKIWGMSAKGVLERPLLGWGQENYYLVFQKHFHPALYSSEPWFDRSHNIFFDWMIHAGIPGLLSFLSLFALALWVVLQGIRRASIPLWSGLILAALFVAHLFQNLFVFDNLNTYLLLFAFLAYTEFLCPPAEVKTFSPGKRGSPFSPTKGGPGSTLKVERRIQVENKRRAIGQAYAVVFALFAALAVGGYFLHLKPILQSKALIRALKITQDVIKEGRSPDEIKAAFEKALAYNSFGTTEVREQLGNVARSIVGDERFSAEERKRFVEFTIEEFRKETAIPAKDVKHLLFLGAIFNRALALDPSYAVQSEQILKEAIKLSPTKQIIYFELAQLYFSTGNADRAIEMLRIAWELDRSFQEAGANVLLAALLTGKSDVAEEMKAKLNFESLNIETLERLGNVYRQKEDLESALWVYDTAAKRYPANAQYRLMRGAMLVYLGRKDEGQKDLEEALRLNPELKEARDILESLK